MEEKIEREEKKEEMELKKESELEEGGKKSSISDVKQRNWKEKVKEGIKKGIGLWVIISLLPIVGRAVERYMKFIWEVFLIEAVGLPRYGEVKEKIWEIEMKNYKEEKERWNKEYEEKIKIKENGKIGNMIWGMWINVRGSGVNWALDSALDDLSYAGEGVSKIVARGILAITRTGNPIWDYIAGTVKGNLQYYGIEYLIEEIVDTKRIKEMINKGMEKLGIEYKIEERTGEEIREQFKEWIGRQPVKPTVEKIEILAREEYEAIKEIMIESFWVDLGQEFSEGLIMLLNFC